MRKIWIEQSQAGMYYSLYEPEGIVACVRGMALDLPDLGYNLSGDPDCRPHTARCLDGRRTVPHCGWIDDASAALARRQDSPVITVAASCSDRHQPGWIRQLASGLGRKICRERDGGFKRCSGTALDCSPRTTFQEKDRTVGSHG